MSALSAISSRRASRRDALAAAVLGAVVFLCSWVALHHGRLAQGQIVDTPVYERYGDLMAAGRVPYRDFAVEYPPAALPAFVLPSLGTSKADLPAYTRRFQVLMCACGVALMVALAFALAAIGATRLRLLAAVAFAGITPVLLGSVILTRFDLWPAALVGVALATILARRVRLAHGTLGLGVAAKIWPGVLVPLFVAYVWRTRGRREALVCAGILAGVVALVFLPFVVLSPGGVWDSLVRQTTRPLQVESLGAALIVASHHVFGTGVVMVSSHGSQNVGGHVANVVGLLQTLVQIAVVFGLWAWFARRSRSRDELVQACAAAVVAFVALGKVVSPQFLIWLIALVPLVRRRHAATLLAISMLLTQAWFPRAYWDYALAFASPQSWYVLLRDLVLLGLLGVLLAPDLRGLRDA